jgi:hypothetical protein
MSNVAKNVENVGRKGVSVVSNLIGGNKRYIEIFLVALILIEYLPHKVMGFQAKKLFDPIMKPIREAFRNPNFHLVLFIILLWSCCIVRDMNLFLLLSIFMMTYRVHQEVEEELLEGLSCGNH